MTDISIGILTGPLPNMDNFFIVADSYLRNIYQVDATTGATAQLLPFGAATSPVALAYDSTAKLLYWSDTNGVHTINGYSLLTNISTVIYRNPSNDGKQADPFYIYRVGQKKLHTAFFAITLPTLNQFS